MDNRAVSLPKIATAGQKPTPPSILTSIDNAATTAAAAAAAAGHGAGHGAASSAPPPAIAPARPAPSNLDLLSPDNQAPPHWRPLQHQQEQWQQLRPHQDQQQVASSWDSAAPSVANVSKRRRKGARVDDGCAECRLRKVSCLGSDVPSGPCKDCAKFGYNCSLVLPATDKFSRVMPDKDRTEAGFPRRRAQKACNECHVHKTKCSGDLPRCQRCERYDLACEYLPSKRKFSHVASLLQPSDPSSQSESQFGGDEATERRQSNVASLQPPPQNDSQLEGAEAWPSSQAKKPGPKPLISPVDFAVSPALPSPSRRTSAEDLYGEDRLFRKDILWRHFDVFFRLWSTQPCMGFMQRDSVHREIDEGRLHPVIAAAVCAMTSRIIHPGQAQIDFADQCGYRVDFYLFRGMDSFLRKDPHENLIVLVCAICHFWHENQMSKVWMYMGLAGRLIKALQYNWDGAGDTLIKQESSRRLVWACYILDRLLAGGFDEHLVLRENEMHLQLPASDAVLYEAVRAEETSTQATAPSASTPKELSLDAHHLRLHRLRHHILGVTKQLTSPTTSHPRRPQLGVSRVMEVVSKLQARLSNFNHSLPENLRLNDANTDRFLNSADGPRFIMLHSLFWILHVDLYRFTIPGIREEADPELMRELPLDFVHKSQRQAVGYAVSLARFWRKLQAIVAKRPPMDGTEGLLTVDQMFAIHVIQPTKILLAARQKHLFDDLEESTAPLVRDEPVDDAALAALVDSNMRLIPPFARFFPRIMDITQDLREAVDNFTHDTPYDRPGAIGAPAIQPSADHRLPGVHYVLENALRPHVPDQDDKERQRERTKYAADRWFQPRKKSREEYTALITPPMTKPREGEEANLPPLLVNGPEIPVWLAEARGCEPLPDTPPQEAGSGTSAAADAQAWVGGLPYPVVGLGLSGLSHTYLFDGTWAVPPSQADLDIMVDQTLGPLLYERAVGSPSMAIPPPMHAGGGAAGGGGPESRGY